jgi:hypothetical protein
MQQFVAELIVESLEELERADTKHGRMLDPEEGWYTLMCEMWELKREMERQNKDFSAYRSEMLQVAAMGLKLLRDCGSEEDFKKIC